MPFGEIKIKPGVNVEQTPTLNQAGISESQFIRFRDGLPEKLGGWNTFPRINNNYCRSQYTGRALHAWEATNNNTSSLTPAQYLAIAQSTGYAPANSGALSYIPSYTSYYTFPTPIDISPWTTPNSTNITFSQTLASVRLATAASLGTVTYANGTDGVGATITNAGTKAALSIDGVAVIAGNRVLIKDQVPTFQNGVYTVTNIGSGSVNWVLTRATDFDQSSEMLNYTAVQITAGATNINQTWYLDWSGTTAPVVGTDPIIFARYNAQYTITPDCRVATTANLSSAYTNGTAGVGAKLTDSTAGTVLVIDGITVALNDRVLVKNQTSALQNGIYTVTTLGVAGSVKWVLTRATDFDQPAEMVLDVSTTITEGTANANTTWYLTGTVTTVGTTAVNFAQYLLGVSTTSGSNIVTITDASVSPTVYWTVNIETPISIGGLILYGLYQIQAIVSATQYTIFAAGNATATVTNGGIVPRFTATSGSSLINVNLNNHGFATGDYAAFPISTSFSGITILGEYRVIAIIDPNNYTIIADAAATSNGSVYMNGGSEYFLYWIGFGPNTTAPPAGDPDNRQYNPLDWTLDNWGTVLVACGQGGPVLLWDPSSANNNATVLPFAPAVNEGVFVAMPQRQIIAYGSTFTGIQDPLLVRWCNVEDYTSWFATSQNQAGSYRIPTGSKIVGGIQAPQQAFLWTDLDLWSMSYNGSATVYSFNKVASGCGLLGQKCMTQMGPNVYWMSQKQFFVANSSGISPIKCPIWDVVFQNYNPEYTQYFRCGANSQFNEIWWFYSSLDNFTPEKPNKYVKYNVIEQVWDYGDLVRTAWIDQSIFGPPIAMEDTLIYQHEISKNAGVDGFGNSVAMDSYFKTGYAVLNNGQDFTFVDWLIPDMKWGYYGGTQGANVLVTLYVTNYPGDTPIAYGPYTIAQATKYIDTRFRGRQVAFKVESSDLNSFWRLGDIRFRYATDGRR
jgi:hypothetical protein